jgi:AcrR family transcriptional regulator
MRTRGAVLDAAQALFLTRGWAGTTIAAIAREAGVAAETVYAAFGSKRAVLQELVARALRGDDPATPLLDQAGPRAVMQAKDQRRQIELFATDIAGILDRVAPLIAIVRTAAETEPEMAAIYGRMHEGRRQNFLAVAEALLANGPLRDGLDAQGAAAIIWRLASPELFMLTRRVERLPPADYAAWLASALALQLLPAETPRADG